MVNEFYSTIADSRKRGTYDSNLELRAYSATALSATGSSTGIAFPVRKTDSFKVCLSVAAYSSYSAGTAEWVITVGVSDVVGGTYTTVGTFTPVGTAVETEIPLSGGLIEDLDSDAAFIRVTATKTGSPGTLTYGAWIVNS